MIWRAAMVWVLAGAGALAEPLPGESLEALGRALFFDETLSVTRTQSCASCHDPERAYTDGLAASPSADGRGLGDRNTPTLGYAMLVPGFHRDKGGNWAGGLFLDGRAGSLEEQAAGPILNPVEMGMADKAAVVARLRENADYVAAFEAHFGADVLGDSAAGFAAATEALAAFEWTPVFAPFDSKYDRYLRGEAVLSDLEERGRALFFDPEASNCALCHQSSDRADAEDELFTNHGYFNIGVPENTGLRRQNGSKAGHVDGGLFQNPQVDALREIGKFRVPTLRNVAVTGPYMHNGVFEDLRSVLLFYNKYQSTEARWQVNPETGQPWRLPEYARSLAVAELTEGDVLKDAEIDALEAFLRTLTDARYTSFLEE